jgi:Kdo2-lipid IVA lauroyltransferase/acyltransferase
VAKKFPSWEDLRPWERVRCRLEYLGLELVARLVPKMSWSTLRRLAWLLGGLVYHLDRRGRSYALANLNMVFGQEKSSTEIHRIACDSYRYFARTMLELFWARNFNRQTYRHLVDLAGYERSRDVCFEGNGVIGVCAHYANFEWLSLTGGFEVTQGIIVTQRFRNPLLGPVFDRLRASGGHRIIPQQHSLLATLRHLKGGGSIGILTDLQLDPRHPLVPIKSFGRWCPVTKMHAVLHKRTGFPIIPMECVPLPDGRYRMVMHEPLLFPPEATEQEIAQKCWDILEPQIRRQPEAWLWAYKHWRNLPAGADPSEYPSYASRSESFDQILQDEVAAQAAAGKDAA